MNHFIKGIFVGTIFGSSMTFFITKRYIHNIYVLVPKKLYTQDPYNKSN